MDVLTDNKRDMIWAEQIRNDNCEAFTNLFEEYYQPLCEYTYRFLHDEELIKDIVQNMFLRIWVNRKKWNPRVEVKSYLYRSVYYQFINDSKKKRIYSDYNDVPEKYLTDNDESQLEKIYALEISASIKSAINKLPPRRKQILVLRFMHELSYKDISLILDISINTIDTQIRRALKLLRRDLKQLALDEHIKVS